MKKSTKNSKKRGWRWFFTRLLLAGFAMLAGGIGVAVAGYFYLAQDLPALYSLRSYRPNIITEVYSDDGTLLAEFADEKRRVVPFEEMPTHVWQAYMVAEDKRFFQHPGLDFRGIVRAMVTDIRHMDLSEGASTISMQVARTFFLSTEKSFKRKLKEVILAIRIEQYLTKEEILSLYINQVDHGRHYYGVGASAKYYFGKSVPELTIGEAAMLAGILPAPWAYNPVYDFDRAKSRQLHVLRIMVDEGYITNEQAEEAYAQPIKVVGDGGPRGEDAAYFVEHVRKLLVERYGREAVYTQGLKVFTTVNLKADRLAKDAVWDRVAGPRGMDKDLGYRGPIKHLSAEAVGKTLEDQEKTYVKRWKNDLRSRFLAEGKGEPRFLEGLKGPGDIDVLGAAAVIAPVGDMLHAPDPAPLEKGESYQAVVARVDDAQFEVWVLTGHSRGRIGKKEMKWAGPYKKDVIEPRLKNPSQILKPGDLIMVRVMEKETDDQGSYYRMALEQESIIQAGLISMSTRTGHVKALRGGLDFYQSQLIRPLQSKRQPGSSMKPIVYAAALDYEDPNGKALYTPATVLYDAPMVFDVGASVCDVQINERYKPRNYNFTFTGPNTLQQALAKSINTIAVRIGWNLCPTEVVKYARRLGIESHLDRLPCLPLGCSELSLEELSTAYNVFASGGYLNEPVYVLRVYDRDGNLLEYEERPGVESQTEIPEAASVEGDETGMMEGLREENIEENDSSRPVLRITHYYLDPPVSPQQIGEPTWNEFLASLRAPDHDWLPSLSTPPKGGQVISAQTAFLMNYLLRTVVTGGTGRSAYRLPHKVAGKTGTTNNSRDALFVGYSPELLAGVWVGCDDYSYSLGKGVSGGKAALPIWIDYMEGALEGRKEVSFPVPKGIEWVKIDTSTGLLAADYTPPENIKTYPFKKGTAPTEFSPASMILPNETSPNLPGESYLHALDQ